MTRHLPILATCFVALSGCLGGGGGGGNSGTLANSGQVGGGTQGNSAPAISGAPGSTVLADQNYTFYPQASDRDGDTLTFTAANLPAWMTLNAATGALSGHPTLADIGTYSGLIITVTDGRRTASLGPFSVTVAASGSGSASLSWTPPTQNTDSSALTDLAGYTVLYGRSPTELVQRVSITNPSVSTFLVENLTSGTWYFAVQAVNSAGQSSSLSSMAMTTIS